MLFIGIIGTLLSLAELSCFGIGSKHNISAIGRALIRRNPGVNYIPQSWTMNLTTGVSLSVNCLTSPDPNT